MKTYRKLSFDEINEWLTKLPSYIENQSYKVIEAEKNLGLAKIDLRINQAGALIASDRPNATEKKCESDIASVSQMNTVVELECILAAIS